MVTFFVFSNNQNEKKAKKRVICLAVIWESGCPEGDKKTLKDAADVGI